MLRSKLFALKTGFNRAVNWFKASMLLKIRLNTAEKRTFPAFMIIGAQKSGTSSLYYYLEQHPQIVPSFLKEIHYFDGGLNPGVDNYQKGPSWYRSFFPKNSDLAAGQIAFEASPMYLFHPLVPERIADLLPDVKLIALLRNPTHRAISHYYHERKLGIEPLSILEAMEKEEARLQESIHKGYYNSKAYVHFSYKARGRYYEQLSRYFKHFGREKIIVINSEDFFKNTRGELKRLLTFLGIDPNFEFQDLAVHGKGKNKSEVPQIVYDYLDDYYKEENRQLSDLLSEDFEW